jgi:hypothetical protein
MPLEFRLGMREQQAEIDAIVLNLSSTLTDIQLDELFAFLLGDYNGDDIVDASDYVVWRKTFGADVPDWTGADGNGDGTIDENDLAVWKANFGSTIAGSGSISGTAVPEPASLALVSMTMLAFGFRHRKVSCGAISTFSERPGGA